MSRRRRHGGVFLGLCLLAGACGAGEGGGPEQSGDAGQAANTEQGGRTASAGQPKADDAVGPGVVDDRGWALDPAVPRSRIVSLIPSVTETLVALGASGRLAARTDYDEQPELARLPSVGGGLDPSLEFLVQLDPGLVVLWPSAGGGGLEARLDDLGIETYAAAIQTITDFRRLTRNLGRLLGLERAADSVISAVDAQMARARASWDGRQPVAAMYVVSRAPAVTAGGGTFLDSIMAAAGAANVFGDMEAEWPQVSLEEVVWRDPRYLIVPSAGGGAMGLGADFAAQAGWAEVPAVLAGRIVPVDASLFGRPGPRMGEAAVRLAERLR